VRGKGNGGRVDLDTCGTRGARYPGCVLHSPGNCKSGSALIDSLKLRENHARRIMNLLYSAIICGSYVLGAHCSE